MPTLNQLLGHERLLGWLRAFEPSRPFDREGLFSSRVVFYGGARFDGQPIELFNRARAAHSFAYVDFGVTAGDVEAELDRSGLLGYRSLVRIHLTRSDLVADGWIPHVNAAEAAASQRGHHGATAPDGWGFLEVMARLDGFWEDHGAERLALLYLGADAIAAYDALFCQRGALSGPFAVVVQDHGFGGNYNRFARGGLLERIADRTGVHPDWLLVSEGQDRWRGYRDVYADAGRGGAQNQRRALYRRL